VCDFTVQRPVQLAEEFGRCVACLLLRQELLADFQVIGNCVLPRSEERERERSYIDCVLVKQSRALSGASEVRGYCVVVCAVTKLHLTQSGAVLKLRFLVWTVGVGYAVAQLVEALRYKPEGRGFDYR
jgi:hypothetical protein